MASNGTYTTFTSIIPRIPMLPQSGAAGYARASALVGDYIVDAENEINLMVSRRYATPFAAASVPPSIRTITRDIASHRTMVATYAKDNINETSYVTYDRAYELLELIQKGKLDLKDTAGSVIAELGAASKIDSNTDAYVPTFNEGPVLAEKVDLNKVRDILEDE